MDNIAKKVFFLDKIRKKIDEALILYYNEPDNVNQFKIHKLYHDITNNNIDSDSDDEETYDNTDSIYDDNLHFEHILENKSNKTVDDFYEKFINYNINNDMINRYADKNYLKLYKNYKMNF